MHLNKNMTTDNNYFELTNIEMTLENWAETELKLEQRRQK